VAEYRCSVKPRLSRSKGASVARATAYIVREKLEDERTGGLYDFSGLKDKALWTGIYAPKNAPEWAHDLQKLSTEIERAEKRKDSQLALPIELSLAHELTVEQNRWMMQDFIKENFTRHGYAAIAAIHEPPHGGDKRNIHAHLLVTLRTIDENGFAKTKTEQQDNYMARRERVEVLRQSWEKHLKHHLKRHGFEKEAAEVSCKSLKEQGIDREPQQHLGPTASDMERKGKNTDRGDLNREVVERNEQLAQLKAAEKEVSQAISEVQKKLDQEARRQKAEAERRAQEWRERDAATAEVIRNAWETSKGDAIGFMIGLNECGLYVAQEGTGYYAAVEKNGFAHRLPKRDMHKAIHVLRQENSGLIIPTLEEQRAEQQKKREQEKEAREREQQRRAARKGAILYDRADMVSMQRDALRHIKDAHRRQEQERRRQEGEQRRQQQQREREEPQRDQHAEKREHKRATTEQSDTKQRKQSAMKKAFNFRASDKERARSGDYEHERER